MAAVTIAAGMPANWAEMTDAVVTAPIAKESWKLAGYHYPGHTELLAELCGVRDFAMMLYLSGWQVSQDGWHVPEHGREEREAEGLGVVHVTLHMALRDVFAHLSTDAVLAKCHLADSVMRRMQVASPRIGVCALNPHAGEDGLFGDEERTAIVPAIAAAREEGMTVAGPLPADTLFSRARGGEFDIVVAMYHDQGHIPVKTLGFEYDERTRRWTGLSGVNVTVGLPFLRVSVDHAKTVEVLEIKEVNMVRYYLVKIGDIEHYYTLDLKWSGSVRDGRVESRMVPPQPYFVWPLKVGEYWTHRGSYETREKKTEQNDTFAVVTVETTEVPAGRFHAFKVVREASRTESDEYWYAPEVHWYVKWIGRRGNVRFEERLREYHMTPRLIPESTSGPPSRSQ